jgi:hypothetical protein
MRSNRNTNYEKKLVICLLGRKEFISEEDDDDEDDEEDEEDRERIEKIFY